MHKSMCVCACETGRGKKRQGSPVSAAGSELGVHDLPQKPCPAAQMHSEIPTAELTCVHWCPVALLNVKVQNTVTFEKVMAL